VAGAGGTVVTHGDGSAEPALENPGYQAAPVTALAMARWTWAVFGALIGVLIGLAAASGGGEKGTATLQLRQPAAADQAAGQKSTGQAVAALAKSDSVLELAVASLRSGPYGQQYAQVHGTLPAPLANRDETPAKNYLAAGLVANWAADSNLVTVEVTRGSSYPRGVSVVEANAVAFATKAKIASDADEAIKNLTDELKNQTRGLPSTAPEVTQLRNDYATQVAKVAFQDKQSVSVIPTKYGYPTGPDVRVSGLLGAAGGTLLGALVAVAAGAGRRRPHSVRELVALAPDLVVRTTVQAGELAGRVLETGRRTVVVLAMPKTDFAASQLGTAIGHHLRTHGATVAVVDRLSSSGGSGQDRLWALRRDVRRNVPANFGADLAVVVCPADEEALSLIAGQSDLLVAVVARRRRTLLGRIRSTMDAVRVAEPVVVLAG
jgi:hypothetical protein